MAQSEVKSQTTNELAAAKPMSIEEIDAAIRVALREPTEPLRRIALRRLAETIDLALFPELLPRLEKHAHKLVRYQMTGWLMQRWAQYDLNAAMAYVQKLPTSLRRQRALVAVVGEWVKQDDAAAIEWVQKQPASQNITKLLGTMLVALVEKDPPKALKIAGSMTEQKMDLQKAVFKKWSELDPAAAAAALSQMPEKDTEVIAQIAKNWAMGDAQAAVAWVKTLPGANPLGKYMGWLMDSLLQTNPQLAKEYGLALPEGETRNQVVRQIARQLGMDNLEAGIAWTEQLPEGSAKSQAKRELLFVKVAIDPKAAMQEANSFPAGPARNDLILDLTIKWAWAGTDAQEASIWASQITNDSLRSSVITWAIGSWARQSPEAAGALAASMSEGETRNTALSRVAWEWAQTNPKAAIEWIDQVSDQNSGESVKSNVISTWAEKDPDAAGLWIKGMPEGAVRDKLTINYAIAVANNYDAADAIPWLKSIGDESERLRATEFVAASWILHDKTSARAWIENADLPKDLKDRLQSQMKP